MSRTWATWSTFCQHNIYKHRPHHLASTVPVESLNRALPFHNSSSRISEPVYSTGAMMTSPSVFILLLLLVVTLSLIQCLHGKGKSEMGDQKNQYNAGHSGKSGVATKFQKQNFLSFQD